MRELSASFPVVCVAMSCLWPGQTLSRDAKVSIVISREASSAERIAAEELSHFLGMMYSDTDFEIVRGKSNDADREIFVGCAESFSELEKHVAGKLEEMPESWQRQYVQELVKTPEAAKLWKAHNFFALSNPCGRLPGSGCIVRSCPWSGRITTTATTWAGPTRRTRISIRGSLTVGRPDTAHPILVRSYPLELQSSGQVTVALKPLMGKAILCGAVLEPVSGDNSRR